jgi:Cytochrome C oxidase, cbb3-type, subunit III
MLGLLLYVFHRNVFAVCFLLAVLGGCGRNERMDKIYAQRCINCHGPAGRGDGSLAAVLPVKPPDFRDTVQRKSVSQIRRVITEGKGVMPAFGPAMEPAQITDMVQMVRFLSREGRDLAWWENFDALVVAHCSIPWETVLDYSETPSTAKPK